MLQSSSLSFLRDLINHNEKPWFDANKDRYLLAKEDMTGLVHRLLEKMIVFAPELKDLEAKNCLFRINRDIRFSKNKTPYKNHLSAAMHPGGKKSIYAGFYLHIQPNNESFCGGGLWAPMPPELSKVRQEIDYCFPEFQKIITAKPFQNYYGSLSREEGQVLKNLPRGFEKDNPAGEYLRFKSFAGMRSLPDKLLVSGDLIPELIKSFKALHPLIIFLNRALE